MKRTIKGLQYNRLTPEMDKQIKELLKTDMSYPMIARKVGVGRATVQRRCKAWGMRNYDGERVLTL